MFQLPVGKLHFKGWKIHLSIHETFFPSPTEFFCILLCLTTSPTIALTQLSISTTSPFSIYTSFHVRLKSFKSAKLIRKLVTNSIKFKLFRLLALCKLTCSVAGDPVTCTKDHIRNGCYAHFIFKNICLLEKYVKLP
jgi:hypothetical protein